MPTVAEIEEIEELVRSWRHGVGNDMLDALEIPEVEGRQANRFRARLALLTNAQTQELKSFFESAFNARITGVRVFGCS